MNEFYVLITLVGQGKLADAQANETPIVLTEMAIGDGNGNIYNPNQSQTGLLNEVDRFSLTSLGVHPENANWVVAEAVIPADTGGYYIREAGIFDDEGDMIYVIKYPETYKPELDEGSTRDLAIRAIMEVTNASLVTLSVDPNVVTATRAWVEAQIYPLSSIPNNSVGAVTPGNWHRIAERDINTAGNEYMCAVSIAPWIELFWTTNTSGAGSVSVRSSHRGSAIRAIRVVVNNTANKVYLDIQADINWGSLPRVRFLNDALSNPDLTTTSAVQFTDVTSLPANDEIDFILGLFINTTIAVVAGYAYTGVSNAYQITRDGEIYSQDLPIRSSLLTIRSLPSIYAGAGGANNDWLRIASRTVSQGRGTSLIQVTGSEGLVPVSNLLFSWSTDSSYRGEIQLMSGSWNLPDIKAVRSVKNETTGAQYLDIQLSDGVDNGLVARVLNSGNGPSNQYPTNNVNFTDVTSLPANDVVDCTLNLLAPNGRACIEGYASDGTNDIYQITYDGDFYRQGVLMATQPYVEALTSVIRSATNISPVGPAAVGNWYRVAQRSGNEGRGGATITIAAGGGSVAASSKTFFWHSDNGYDQTVLLQSSSAVGTGFDTVRLVRNEVLGEVYFDIRAEVAFANNLEVIIRDNDIPSGFTTTFINFTNVTSLPANNELSCSMDLIVDTNKRLIQAGSRTGSDLFFAIDEIGALYQAGTNMVVSENFLQVQSSVSSQGVSYAPGESTITLTITVTPRRADSYLLVEFEDFLVVETDGAPTSHKVNAKIHWSRGDKDICEKVYNKLVNAPAEVAVHLKSIRPSASLDPVTFSVKYVVQADTTLIRSSDPPSLNSDSGYHSFKVTELLLAQTSILDT